MLRPGRGTEPPHAPNDDVEGSKPKQLDWRALLKRRYARSHNKFLVILVGSFLVPFALVRGPSTHRQATACDNL
jgi:hypothetical protein